MANARADGERSFAGREVSCELPADHSLGVQAYRRWGIDPSISIVTSFKSSR